MILPPFLFPWSLASELRSRLTIRSVAKTVTFPPYCCMEREFLETTHQPDSELWPGRAVFHLPLCPRFPPAGGTWQRWLRRPGSWSGCPVDWAPSLWDGGTGVSPCTWLYPTFSPLLCLLSESQASTHLNPHILLATGSSPGKVICVSPPRKLVGLG